MEKTFENINDEEHSEPNTDSNAEISEKNLSHNKSDNRNKKEQCGQQGIYTLHRKLSSFLISKSNYSIQIVSSKMF